MPSWARRQTRNVAGVLIEVKYAKPLGRLAGLFYASWGGREKREDGGRLSLMVWSGAL